MKDTYYHRLKYMIVYLSNKGEIATSTLSIFLVMIIIISCYHNILTLRVYAQFENRSISSLLNTVDNTLNSITKGLFNLPKHFEYTIDLDTKEVFPNQTVEERILNKYEPTKYSIPILNYNLLGFNISATNIQIQTDSTKIQDNITMIEFPIMMADNVRVNSSLTDLSFDSVDLSSIYVIYDQRVDKFTVHIPIMTAVTYLP
jgi:hypothetical protein